MRLSYTFINFNSVTLEVDNMSESNNPSPNKEPFDFLTFAKMYPNSNGPARLIEHPNPVDSAFYTKLYYEDDSVSTIAEFVDKLDKQDESS